MCAESTTFIKLGMKVVEFSAEGSEWTSQGRLVNPPMTSNEDVTALTVCHRLKIYRFLPTIYWINILEYQAVGTDICCELRISKHQGTGTTWVGRNTCNLRPCKVWVDSGPIVMLHNVFVAHSNIQVELMQWYHCCFTYDYKTGSFQMVLDGKVITSGRHDYGLEELSSESALIVTATMYRCLRRVSGYGY